MIDDVIFTPEARDDLVEAFGWYEARSAGLGHEFLREVEKCVLAIPRTPRAFTLVKKNYRRAVVQRFPYVVFYEFENSLVTIYSVFHTSQNPAKWRRRLP
jgi:plasmid stabilization system protein ParE